MTLNVTIESKCQIGHVKADGSAATCITLQCVTSHTNSKFVSHNCATSWTASEQVAAVFRFYLMLVASGDSGTNGVIHQVY